MSKLINRTPAVWEGILIDLGVAEATAARWAPHYSEILQGDALSAGEDELPPFVGQTLHESTMLEHTTESLNYSASRLTIVWPSRFPTVEDAKPYARNPKALAERVYGGRMGNGPEGSGDGFAYIGRGVLQVTGKDNYALVSRVLGYDFVADPQALAMPANALRSAVAWWEKNLPDDVMADCRRLTKRINGGYTGLAHRQQLTVDAWTALQA